MANFDLYQYMPEARDERERIRAGAVQSFWLAVPASLIFSYVFFPGLSLHCLLPMAVAAALLIIKQGLVTLATTCDIAVGEHELRLYVLDPWTIDLGFWGTVVKPWLVTIHLETLQKAEFFTCEGRYHPVRLWFMRTRTKDETLADAISVPGLGIIGYLTGLSYGLGLRPVFIVSPNHERQYQLLRKLYQLAGKGETSCQKP